MISQMLERRAFKRIDRSYSALFKSESTGSQDRVTLKDLSAGGASFLMSKKLNPGSRIKMNITIFPNKPPVECQAKVLRSGNLQSRELFPTAVEFTDIDRVQQSRIEDIALAIA
jgi:c-di-GMP-binding flagellar brake protein YcgR